jgi:hypothetical protein
MGASVVFACKVLSLSGEICWKMDSSCVDIIDGAGVPQQDLMKQSGNIGLGFFSPLVLEKHVVGTRDYILHDPFPAA